MPSWENDQVRVVELDVHRKPNCIEIDHRKWNPLEEGIPGNASKFCQPFIKCIFNWLFNCLNYSRRKDVFNLDKSNMIQLISLPPSA